MSQPTESLEKTSSEPSAPSLSPRPDLFSNPTIRHHRAELRKKYILMLIDAQAVDQWSEMNDRFFEIIDEELDAAFGKFF